MYFIYLAAKPNFCSIWGSGWGCWESEMSMDIDQKAILEISVSVYSAFGKENRAGIPDNSAQWLGTLPFNELHSSPLSPQSTLFRDALGQVHP